MKDPRRALPRIVALLAAGYLPLLLISPLPVTAGSAASCSPRSPSWPPRPS